MGDSSVAAAAPPVAPRGDDDESGSEPDVAALLNEEGYVSAEDEDFAPDDKDDAEDDADFAGLVAEEDVPVSAVRAAAAASAKPAVPSAAAATVQGAAGKQTGQKPRATGKGSGGGSAAPTTAPRRSTDALFEEMKQLDDELVRSKRQARAVGSEADVQDRRWLAQACTTHAPQPRRAGAAPVAISKLLIGAVTASGASSAPTKLPIGVRQLLRKAPRSVLDGDDVDGDSGGGGEGGGGAASAGVADSGEEWRKRRRVLQPPSAEDVERAARARTAVASTKVAVAERVKFAGKTVECVLPLLPCVCIARALRRLREPALVCGLALRTGHECPCPCLCMPARECVCERAFIHTCAIVRVIGIVPQL
jgi:hypothetical protein